MVALRDASQRLLVGHDVDAVPWAEAALLLRLVTTA